MTWTTDNEVQVVFGEGETFVDGVLRVAREENLGKFRVFINGEEVEPDDAPEFPEDGWEVSLMKYDTAG